jgi:hypothetical protein
VADDKKGGAVAVATAVFLLPLVTVFSIILVGSQQDCGTGPGTANGAGVSVDPSKVPDTTIAGYDHDQLVIAANVIQAGKDLSLNVRDQTIGVMTAMGESSLQNLDYGDEGQGVTNPDGTPTCSVGVFQQQWCLPGAPWGTKAEAMNPLIASTHFFQSMTAKVPERESIEPTMVAHRTQGNADPYYYTQFWEPAVQVIEGLANIDTGLNPGNGAPSAGCDSLVPGQVSPNGWAAPGAGPITDPYGMRQHPITGEYKMHSGTDLAAGGCDGPIWAAQAGTVSFRGFDSGGNGTITIDHGGGVQTKYLHMFDSGMLVNVGDKVTAGQQIAKTGTSGQSTGCHLHFMVVVNGETVDPAAYMAQVGITLGQ